MDAPLPPGGRAAHRDAEAARPRPPRRAAAASLRDGLAGLHLDTVELGPAWEDVLDPAGGDLEVFEACAKEIADLLHVVIPRLR